MHFEIIRPPGEAAPSQKVIKVGILPFMKDKAAPGKLKIMVMKPVAEKEILGAPDFQLAKGTRRINISGDWCDMREDDLIFADESFHEPLIQTALREGNEEIGLQSLNIRKVYDCGVFSFISASKGIRKPLHMFAAEVIQEDDFISFEATTSETKWFLPEEFKNQGRADHVEIVDELIVRLKGML